MQLEVLKEVHKLLNLLLLYILLVLIHIWVNLCGSLVHNLVLYLLRDRVSKFLKKLLLLLYDLIVSIRMHCECQLSRLLVLQGNNKSLKICILFC